MSMSEPPPELAASTTGLSYVQWGAVLAGALIAAAVSFVLLSFGSAIGLAVTPLATSWRTSTMLLGGLSGFWILVVSVGAMATGGYVAGRMRSTWHIVQSDVVEFRDGVHGLVVWALAVTLGAVLSGFAAMALVAGAAASERDSRAGAPVAIAYEVDRLFWPGRGSVIARLLTSATKNPGLSDDDHARLTDLVAATARVAPATAEVRVRQSVASIRDKIAAGRRAAIILAFITAAALAVGAAAAWQAACIGGRHRDATAPPSLGWRRARAAPRRT
jgi:hypothetical protein